MNTRTGRPQGNILYSANALYIWLRHAVRRRLGETGLDPVEAAITAYLKARAPLS
ncbi:MAG: hypothetical protein P4K98_08655 [Bryobacteraceae bacterium]|nr:hypothetical protein [Bryobacteraceae bacterium]